MPAKRATKKSSKKAGPKKRTVRKPAAKQKAATRKHPIKVPPLRNAVERLREICLGLPEATEVEAWGEPTFRVNGKIFAMHASSGTHHAEDDRPAVWILSVSIEQDFVIRARPDRYFKPPYVGPSGWIGAWLDRNPPWNEITELLRDGWRRRAPKKIASLLPD